MRSPQPYSDPSPAGFTTQKMKFKLPLFMLMLATNQQILRASLISHSDIYEKAPWTGDGEWVSLETHEDGTPFTPVPGDGGLCGALTAEVENFTFTGGFNVTEWGRDHYYGATFENTFAHSKALLHAKNNSVGTATGTIAIPKANTYYVGVRYEAAYLFETVKLVGLVQTIISFTPPCLTLLLSDRLLTGFE